MIPDYFLYFGFVFYAIGYYFYIRDMFRGETKPNLVSWVLWMLPAIIGAYFEFKAGAGLSALPVLVGGLGPVMIVLICIFRRVGYWQINTFDLICGGISIFALILYIATHNLAISITFAILSDLLAFVPTFRKTWTNPESETGLMYIASMTSNIVGLLIIKNWIFSIYSFGGYLVLGNLLEVIFIYRRKIFKTNVILP